MPQNPLVLGLPLRTFRCVWESQIKSDMIRCFDLELVDLATMVGIMASTTFTVQCKCAPRRRHSDEEKGRGRSSFTFININQPDQSKEAVVRRFVRSNAMRKYRQQEKQKAIAKHLHEPLAGLVTNADNALFPEITDADLLESNKEAWQHSACHKAVPTLEQALQPLSETSHAVETQEVRSCSAQQLITEVLASPINTLGSGEDDPFDTYPIKCHSRYNSHVLHHCELPALSQFVH